MNETLQYISIFLLGFSTGWIISFVRSIVNGSNERISEIEARQEQNKADSDKRFAEYKKQLEDFKNKPIL